MNDVERRRPDWPALMDTETARAYLGGMATASFRGLAARSGVAPIDLGFERTFWRRRDLDGLVERLPVRLAKVATPREADQICIAESALAAVSRRAVQRVRRR